MPDEIAKTYEEYRKQKCEWCAKGKLALKGDHRQEIHIHSVAQIEQAGITRDKAMVTDCTAPSRDAFESELVDEICRFRKEVAYGTRPEINLEGTPCADTKQACCVCSGDICTIENCEEHPYGARLTTGEWCCSVECWDIAASDYAEKLRREAGRLGKVIEAVYGLAARALAEPAGTGELIEICTVIEAALAAGKPKEEPNAKA